MTALLAAYFSTKYTAEFYKRNSEIAGITGFVFSLIISSRELFSAPLDDGLLTRVNLPSNINLIFAIFIGYLVGQIFRLIDRKCPKEDLGLTSDPKRLRPIFFSLLLAVVLNILFYIGSVYNDFTTVNNFLAGIISSSSSLLTSFTNAFLTTSFAWLGMSSAYQMTNFTDDVYSLENLTYALKNHSTQNIPHPYTEATLYHGFGAFGGVGSLLALIIAILLVSKSQKDRKVSMLGIFPALFNNGAPVMLGIPVMFNIVYLIPFLLAPLVNMLLALCRSGKQSHAASRLPCASRNA